MALAVIKRLFFTNPENFVKIRSVVSEILCLISEAYRYLKNTR